MKGEEWVCVLDTQKQLWIIRALWQQVLTPMDSSMAKKGPVLFTVRVNGRGYSQFISSDPSVLQKP